LPDFLVRLIAVFVPKIRNVSEALNWNYGLSTEQARSLLSWSPRPYEQTIVEMAESLVERQMV
jgi:dihydroflavonol-4-reductase